MTPLPPIRYVRTTDGSQIAFHAVGHGPAVVLLFPYHVNHLTLNWRVPLHRRAIELLARTFRVVNLDFRGAGESAGHFVPLSLDGFSDDLGAVLDELGIATACICAMGPAALPACHFAVRAPNRVTAIAFIQGGESAANRKVLQLRRDNAEIEARLRGALLGGADDNENATALAAVALHALEPRSLVEWEHVLEETRLAEIAQRVSAPSLCLHATDDDLIPLSACAELASSLQQATLHGIEATTGMQLWRSPETLDALTAFFALHSKIEPKSKRGRRRTGPERRYPASLTAREIEVLGLVAAGKTNRQVAADLFISLNTVSHHLRSIFSKTRSANRTEAAAFAHQHGLA